MVLINSLVGKGQTPYALKFGETYNDPQGPWLRFAREALFGDVAKLPELNETLNQSLTQ
ncbi:hypothetical protein [Herbidospora solisilvae]|uniref:hypothetical protein n=1 Tax=Herbidospora solisilvae TaxID=2696284 RepID=UPI001F2253B0|nr:hypothetical protein [Herbidospora solisilvae]